MLYSKTSNNEIISSGLTPTKCEIAGGGYSAVGNIVIISVRLTISEELKPNDVVTISGFPTPKNFGVENYIPCIVNVTGFNAYMGGDLTLTAMETIQPKTILVGGVYVKR